MMHRADLRTSMPGMQSFPVSVKGVLLKEGRVVLLKNEREDLHVEVVPLLDAWVYRIPRSGDVLVVAYGCTSVDFTPLRHSEEHHASGTFGSDELGTIAIPDGYRRAIRAWFERSNGGHP